VIAGGRGVLVRLGVVDGGDKAVVAAKSDPRVDMVVTADRH
jgi:hypothetical protein